MSVYGPLIYLILFLIVFCETGLVITPFLPGDSLLFIAGTLATTGPINIHLLVALLISAAVCGDNVNYTIGRTLGLKLFQRSNSKLFRRAYIEQAQAFYNKHGGKTVLFARFAPIVRTFVPFVAGIGKMHYPRFLAFSFIGSVVWVGSFCYAGFLFGNLPIVRNNLKLLIVSIIFLSLLPGLLAWWQEKRKPRALV